jgi:hypothetical protein
MYQYLTSKQFGYPHVGYFDAILRLIINTMHLPIYMSNTNEYVHEPYVVTLSNRTPIFEWYMARLIVKNIH